MSTVPPNVRNAFLDLINDDTQDAAACDLVARLLECQDVLPMEYCDMLDLPQGTTFGQAAIRVRATLGCQG